MAKITKIEQVVPAIKPRKKVAAYARVSMESERMNHSLSAQISYYSSLIQKNPEWQYAGVFADCGISGTGTKKRDEFNRMIEAATNGEIDIILTKSIQRFARNTVDLLKTVRNLKDIGVEVRFEKEHISSTSGDGELMLTILASFAQEESRSISENTKWAKSKASEKGAMTNGSAPFGYRCENGTLYIVPEKADIVKMIFSDYTENKMTIYQITKKLNNCGIPSPRGSVWTQGVVSRLLKNVTYTGNMLLGKTYVESYLTHRRIWNKGERKSYFVEGTHEPIISQEFFNKTQDILKSCKNLGRRANRNIQYHCFTGKIICGGCGRAFGRKMYKTKTKGDQYTWFCRKEPHKCPTAVIYESELEAIITEMLGVESFSETDFEEKINNISIGLDDVIHITTKDGSAMDYQYTRKIERRQKNGTKESNNYTCDNK